VARVFFHRNHRRVLRKIMKDIWRIPMRPEVRNWFRLRADGSIDMTPNGLTLALGGWGFRNARVNEFIFRWVQLVSATADRYEAKTGVNPIMGVFKKLGVEPEPVPPEPPEPPRPKPHLVSDNG
jgi:hypothetical protein